MKMIFISMMILFFSNFLFCDKLTISWWNVNNFFDTVDDPQTEDMVLSPEKYNEKLKAVSEKIKSINADIIGLAEVENMTVLKAIASNAGYGYYYLESGNDPRGINIALLSKFRVKYKSNKDQKTPYKGNLNFKFSRDCAQAELTINDKRFYILLNHLKSRVAEKNENTEIKRIAQVNGILDIISGIYKDNKSEPDLLLLGDLNDTRHSVTLNSFEKSGLVIINYLYDQKKYYTYEYKNEKEDSDYIIMNRSLYKKAKIRKYATYNSRDYLDISDHYPVFLEMEF
jgi:predicted extracellular nuclease